ncbi:MAG TPA: type II secretion system protein GspC [Xanthomonadaceae bacterium]|nr:type II secretion system protein GspC [Xanthomonadaceae bacterium]
MSSALALRPGSPAIARVAALAAAVLLAVVVARLIWLLLAGPALPPIQSPAGPGLQRSVEPTGSAAQWHLFGNAAPLTRAVQAPETELRLQLRGTLNTTGQDQGLAIIADAQGNERAYRIGERLAEGARLIAVHEARVLLEREDGRTEALSLPGIRSDAREPVPATAPGADGTPFVNPLISTGGPSIEAARQSLAPDLAVLSREISVLPVIENGRIRGVRLAVGRDSDLYARTGLRPGDVIVAVNGVPLDGPERQQQLLESLRGAQALRVTVLREGSESEMRIGLR